MKKLKGARGWVMGWVLLKQRLIKADTGIDYCTIEDILDVAERFTDEECKEIREEMTHNGLYGFIDLDDSESCPWCIKYSQDCTQCTYRVNNRWCMDDDSIYTKIKAKMPKYTDFVEHYPELLEYLEKSLKNKGGKL